MVLSIITLTTDFGQADGYVGTMKGVILARAPQARLVDLSHEIAPQDILAGAFVLARAYRYFPPETIHVAVVDPGVGTSRRALLLETAQGRFVGPDNGLFSLVLRETVALAIGWIGAPADVPALWHPGFDLAASLRSTPTERLPRAYALTNADYWLEGPGATFHGRDVFAPVAAHLAAGEPPERLGTPIPLASLVLLPNLTPTLHADAIEGRVIAVDRFGNLITNIAAGLLRALGALETLEVKLGTLRLVGVQAAYGAVPAGEPLALINSAGLLEIAVTNGSAVQTFQESVGASVQCRPHA
jgi:S-adenosylmethionine hydrolase